MGHSPIRCCCSALIRVVKQKLLLTMMGIYRHKERCARVRSLPLYEKTPLTDPSDIGLTKFQVVVITIGLPSGLIVFAGRDVLFDLLRYRHVQGTIVTRSSRHLSVVVLPVTSPARPGHDSRPVSQPGVLRISLFSTTVVLVHVGRSEVDMAEFDVESSLSTGR